MRKYSSCRTRLVSWPVLTFHFSSASVCRFKKKLCETGNLGSVVYNFSSPWSFQVLSPILFKRIHFVPSLKKMRFFLVILTCLIIGVVGAIPRPNKTRVKDEVNLISFFYDSFREVNILDFSIGTE